MHCLLSTKSHLLQDADLGQQFFSFALQLRQTYLLTQGHATNNNQQDCLGTMQTLNRVYWSINI